MCIQNKNFEVLSDIEKEYVRLTIEECLSRKEVAVRQHRSEDTVSTQMKNIYRKLEITKVTELAKLFYKGALIISLIISPAMLDNNIQRHLRRYRRSREVEVFIPLYSTEQL